jgi:hypothetical protein
MPKGDPHSSLNFEEGEVIYENPGLVEWSKFYTMTGFSAYLFCAGFIPYSLIIGTHLPLAAAYDNIFLPYYSHSYFNFDVNGFHIPIVAGAFGYGAYYFLASGHRYMKDYVVRA